MTWRLTPPTLPASDEGWARAALPRGDAAAAVGAFRGHSHGARLPDGALPAAIRPEGRAPLPPLFALRFGLLVASGAVRAAVEAAAPGRHRFWAVAVRRGAGQGTEAWHGLIVRAAARALDEGRSACRVEPAEPLLGLARRATLAGVAGVAPDRLPAEALWWDHGLSVPYLLCDDALAARLHALGATGLERCRT